MLKLYLLHVAPLAEREIFARGLARVDFERREKVLAYKFAKDQALSLGAGLLLQYALAQEDFAEMPVQSAQKSFSYNEYGKPFLAGAPPHCNLHFNLSHSGEYAVCAISDDEVGVDVEEVREIDLLVAQRCFVERELARIVNAQGQINLDEFYCHWTAKESFIKAIGTGLSLDPRECEIHSEVYCEVLPKVLPENSLRIKHSFNSRDYFCKIYDELHGYKIAVCSPHKFFPHQIEVVNFEVI